MIRTKDIFVNIINVIFNDILTYDIKYAIISIEVIVMITANASNFRKNLYGTLEQVAKYNQVATVNTKDGDVVMISADDYNNLMETLYISSVQGLKQDLLKAKKATASDFVSEDEVEW